VIKELVVDPVAGSPRMAMPLPRRAVGLALKSNASMAHQPMNCCANKLVSKSLRGQSLSKLSRLNVHWLYRLPAKQQ